LLWNFADPGPGNYAELYISDTSSGYFIGWDNFNFTGPVTTTSYGNLSSSASYGTPQDGPMVVGTSIPEPASAVLLLSSLAVLPSFRRRAR
jgi:hypothetical protein